MNRACKFQQLQIQLVGGEIYVELSTEYRF